MTPFESNKDSPNGCRADAESYCNFPMCHIAFQCEDFSNGCFSQFWSTVLFPSCDVLPQGLHAQPSFAICINRIIPMCPGKQMTIAATGRVIAMVTNQNAIGDWAMNRSIHNAVSQLTATFSVDINPDEPISLLICKTYPWPAMTNPLMTSTCLAGACIPIDPFRNTIFNRNPRVDSRHLRSSFSYGESRSRLAFSRINDSSTPACVSPSFLASASSKRFASGVSRKLVGSLGE